MVLHNDKVTFIYIALFTIQIVKKTLIKQIGHLALSHFLFRSK